MSLIEAIILGILQGLTEFLPVSSSAHLLILPWIMGWVEPPFVFDMALNIGTLAALFIYFRNDISELTKGFLRLLVTRNIKTDTQARLSLYVLLGTIPAAVIGFLFEKKIEAYFHSPYVIAFTLIFWGIMLWFVDKKSKRVKDLEDLTFFDAFFVGFAQVLALIPGTSRSGVTMTSALFANFKKETAARFSFLLSIPITTGATLYKMKDLLNINIDSNVIINFSAGVIASGIVGYLCIAYLIKFLKTNSFAVFAIYRVMLGVFLAFTIPNLLQGKIDLDGMNTCFINSNQEKVTREKTEKYIMVAKGDKVILEPKFTNLTSSKLEDLQLSLTVESTLAKQINISPKVEFEIDALDFFPKAACNCSKVSEISSMGKNYPFIVEISDKAKVGTKIRLTFGITNINGKRLEFEQVLKVVDVH